MNVKLKLLFCALSVVTAGLWASSCSSSSGELPDPSQPLSGPPSKAELEAAGRGERDACFNVGLRYFLLASQSSSPEQAAKDYSESFKFFSKAADAGDARALVQLGVMYEGGLGVKQDSILAARRYRMASDSGDPDGQNALASFWLRIGSNIDDAEALVRKAIAQRPSYPLYQVVLAEILYAQGRHEEGAKAFEALKSSKPEAQPLMRSVSAFYAERASESVQNGDWASALASYEKALDFSPDDLPLLELYGAACAKSGQPKRASALFDAAVDKAPDEIAPRLARAAFKRLCGENQAAFDELASANAKFPASSAARVAFGALCSDLGRKELALRSFDEALRIDPACADALELRASLKASSGDFQGALNDYDALLDSEPANAKALVGEAKCLSALGRYGQAAAACSKALKLDPSDASALLCRADALMSLGDFKAAEKDCAAALAIDPDAPFGRFIRGRANMGLGKEAEAVEDFDAALKLDPSSVPALFLKASIMLKQGKALGVLSVLRGPLVDADPGLLVLRARAALLAREPDKAVADLEKAVKLDGEKPEAWNLKSFALLSARRYAEAEAAATRAIDLGDKDKGVRFVRGRARMEQGKPERALSDFDFLVEASPSDAEAYQLRGSAKSLAGRYADARADFQKASSLDASSTPCKLDLSEALIMDRQPEKAYEVASQAFKEASPEQFDFKAVAVYLKCVSGLLSQREAKDDMAAFDAAIAEGSAEKWSTASFEKWLNAAQLPPELKASIEGLTAKLKAKRGSDAGATP